MASSLEPASASCSCRGASCSPPGGALALSRSESLGATHFLSKRTRLGDSLSLCASVSINFKGKDSGAAWI